MMMAGHFRRAMQENCRALAGELERGIMLAVEPERSAAKP